jgi:DNA-directed RNA polymerase subunit RPC12/RpoP
MTNEGYLYWECPDCGWDTVLHAKKAGQSCPLCASDSGHFVRLRARPARSTDRPEGPDDRKFEQPALARSTPPWTAEQVENLGRWQTCGWVHPYTCPNGSTLLPREDGWVCPHCAYRQTWCWAPMLNGPPPDPREALFNG